MKEHKVTTCGFSQFQHVSTSEPPNKLENYPCLSVLHKPLISPGDANSEEPEEDEDQQLVAVPGQRLP